MAALKAGGNAVDAACATALAIGLTNPNGSGIGGGGFAMLYLAKDKKVVALDFRERAPAALKPELFLKDGKAEVERAQLGGLASGVPGELRGLEDMVRRFGRLPFARCAAVGERMARDGVPVSWKLGQAIGHALEGEGKAGDPAFRALVAPGGKPLAQGALLRRPDLARTFAAIRKGGADAFYRGPIAAEIVRAVRAAGGVLGPEDLAGYTVTERTPVDTTYRGLRVVSMPPPSSGGIAEIETLGILATRVPEPMRLGHNSSAYLHVLGEAFKHAFADRARHLGDPDFVAVPLGHLADPAYHRELGGRVKDGVLPRDAYGTPDRSANALRDGGTTHLSVVDADGNAVALTTTVNLLFGARFIAGSTGVLMNDQIDDFSLQPGVPNAFGLVGNAQNAVAPGKRPLSSMTPTIVLDGDRVRLVVGAAGGPTIITATTQVLLNVVDFKMDAQAAVSAPRVHHQWLPEVLEHEPDLGRDAVDALGKRGHKTQVRASLGVVNLVVATPQGLEAAFDPRSGGAPAGY